MDLDPMVSTGSEDYSYSDYDNRPIRPMNQEALNETLARLPILIDEEDYNNRTNASSDSNTSIKARLTNRRQPNLAYSTRRKNLPLGTSTVQSNTNQSLLHVNTTMATPKSNKRKLGGCTPAVTPSASKVIKQRDCRQELVQLKEENRLLEQSKENLQLECILLKNSHETELDLLKQEHQQAIDALSQEHQSQCEQFKASLADKDQQLSQTNLEVENLRNDRAMLVLEKETLDKIVSDYQVLKEEMTVKLNENDLVIKQLREELESLKKVQQKKQSTVLANGRIPLKGSTTDRPRTIGSAVPANSKSDSIRSKTNVKASISRAMKKDERVTTPSSSVNTSLNKSNSSLCSSTSTLKAAPSKSKTKTSLILEEKKKSIASLDIRPGLISARTRSKAMPSK